MNRSDLIQDLAMRCNQDLADAAQAVGVILDAMSQALEHGNRIEIRGFGSFSIAQRAPYTGRNPRNGDSIQVASKRKLRFKPGKELRQRVDSAAVPPTPV